MLVSRDSAACSDKSSRTGRGEAATRPATVLNVMDSGDDWRGNTLTVHGAHMGTRDDDDEDSGSCDLKGDGWSTALCECMSPDAKSIFDWGYVCTSCACPCLQFYFNWLSILKGAPVCALMPLLAAGTGEYYILESLYYSGDPHMLRGLHDVCMLALSVPRCVSSPRALCAALGAVPGKWSFPGILCQQDERFYCLAGPCCSCGDPVHAAGMTLCCIVGYPFISCKVRGVRLA